MSLPQNEKAEEVSKLYRRILLREADPEALRRYVEADLSIVQIENSIYSSNEFATKVKPLIDRISTERRKLLIFGAYGNGNLGDAIQANCLAAALEKYLPNHEIWAGTTLPNRYNFPEGKKLPTWAIRAPQILKEFDAVVIGGGGLFSHPHDPLQESSWARSVEIPTYILGVGATSKVAHNSIELIKRSALVSARDYVSLRALSEIRPDVSIIRDPVLCTANFVGSCNNSRGTVWILKGPLSTDHAFIRRHIRETDRVICFEPKVDCALEEFFPEMVYTPTIESVNAIIRDASTVITSRYHGAILALLLGKRVIGYGDQKIQSLLNDLDQPTCFLTHIADLDFTVEFDPKKIQQHFISWKEDFYKALADIAAEIH